SVAAACSQDAPVTPGTGWVGGPSLTCRCTLSPGSAPAPATGSWEITSSRGRLLSTRSVVTARPACCSLWVASGSGSPTTDGTSIGARPWLTVTVTSWPGATSAPTSGATESTRPCGTVSL